MKHATMVVAAAINLLGSVAMAQSPAAALVGRWVAQSGYCGQAISDVTNVEANGTVRGTFTCLKTNWTPTMGDVLGANAVKGTLTGNHFVMVNVQGGGTDLILNGSKLEGTGTVRASAARASMIFYKQ